MLGAARRIRVGRLTVMLPDGTRRVFGDPTSSRAGEIHFHDAAAATRMLVGGEIGAGEAYMDGLWSSPDLPALLRFAALNREALALPRGWWRVPLRVKNTVAHRARRNTLTGSRRNIEAHYDLGNDFYGLFLDPTMAYSSAVFTSPGQSLEDAQREKFRVIAERAGLRGGEHVLEIGSGWGGFALYAAGELGCRVTTITVSQAQQRLAAERIAAAGLADRVSVELRDYRDIRGTYDAIVSIEMLEAVGAEFFRAYFEVCDRALVAGGRMSRFVRRRDCSMTARDGRSPPGKM
jgi:cyclopropane-fatty-acyl-phospholipid synthase